VIKTQVESSDHDEQENLTLCNDEVEQEPVLPKVVKGSQSDHMKSKMIQLAKINSPKKQVSYTLQPEDAQLSNRNQESCAQQINQTHLANNFLRHQIYNR